MKEQEEPEKNPNEMEINNLPGKDYKEVVTSMLNKVKSRIEELRDNFNKEKNIVKNQLEKEVGEGVGG